MRWNERHVKESEQEGSQNEEQKLHLSTYNCISITPLHTWTICVYLGFFPVVWLGPLFRSHPQSYCSFLWVKRSKCLLSRVQQLAWTCEISLLLIMTTVIITGWLERVYLARDPATTGLLITSSKTADADTSPRTRKSFLKSNSCYRKDTTSVLAKWAKLLHGSMLRKALCRSKPSELVARQT